MRSNFTRNDLIEIYDNLNSYQWDYRLGVKPHGFDDMPNRDKKGYQDKHTIIRPYMQILGCVLAEKEVLKYHHLNNLERTNAEFQWWWIKRKIRMAFPGSPF